MKFSQLVKFSQRATQPEGRPPDIWLEAPRAAAANGANARPTVAEERASAPCTPSAEHLHQPTTPESLSMPCDKGHRKRMLLGVVCCHLSPVPLQPIQRASLVSVTKDTLCFCPATCNLFIVTYKSQ